MTLITTIRVAVLISAFGGSAVSMPAQSVHCFSLTVWKDGSQISEPDSVTVLDATRQITVDRDNGQYCLPALWAESQKLDLSFRVQGDRLYASSIAICFFSFHWTVKYGSDINQQLPRRHKPKIRAACMIEVDSGEPGIGMLINPCVAPAIAQK